MTTAAQNAVCKSCAETIPGVVEAFGPSSWKKVRDLYMALMKMDPKIQVELAKNIHNLSTRLDKQVVQTDIL